MMVQNEPKYAARLCKYVKVLRLTVSFVWISDSVFICNLSKNASARFLSSLLWRFCTAVMFTEPTCYQDCVLGLTALRLWRYLVYERLRLPPPPISFDFELRNVKNVLMSPI